MNLTQWLLVLGVAVVAYGFFVWKTESNGRIDHRSNAIAGIILVPVLLGLLPFLLVMVCADLVSKRKWGPAAICALILLVVVGYGGLVFHLRDGPAPSPHDLPVELPLER